MAAAGLSVEHLRALLDYDPSTGVFRWRVRAGKNVRAGAVAGSVTGEGYRVIVARGIPHRAARLAWLFATGEWPREQIGHRNGDKDDTRFANLRERCPEPGTRLAERRRLMQHAAALANLEAGVDRELEASLRDFGAQHGQR